MDKNFEIENELSLIDQETRDDQECQQLLSKFEQSSLEEDIAKQNYRQMTRTQWYLSLYKTYDPTFINVMTLSYFIQGFKTFIDLSVLDLFKSYLHLQPAEMQILTSIINIPWSIKVVYGMIADNLPLFGSKRKNYIALNGLLQFIVLLPLIPEWINNKYIITFFLTFFAVNIAFNDAMIDALMVMQARKDPFYGSQNLNSFTWTWLSIGGITGSISAGFLTQYLNPHISFTICGILGLMIMTLSIMMNKTVEQENQGQQKPANMKDFKKNIVRIKEALATPQIYKTLAYFILCGTLHAYTPVIYKFTNRNYDLQQILLRMGVQDTSSAKSVILFIWRSLLPTVVIFTQITPHHIEATIFATLTGAFNFSQSVGAPLLGSVFCKIVGVTSDDLSGYSKLLLIQIAAICLTFFYINLVPTRKEIDEAQKREKEKFENETKEMIIE
ncbi:folate-biopterin transporter family [Stylonychia lemnae]|uniref:Folate-biopterin transporter family n=1 Tax=Stylonychia lemnae TaxID=5949 RepID=A0A078AL42_STYLE|nr:folate-biopterin transporter family [Stylonychia lemnae]|eukprot:CDW82904.1 folate-biopterin transporter family [Stylonychia lemnae]